MKSLKIIITGGATRIGAAIAESLASNNNQITIHYNKSKKKAEKLKKNLEKKGSKVFLIKAKLNKNTKLPFEGNVVVVTGGAGKIGSAISELLVKYGAHVAVLDIDYNREI